MLDAFLHEPCIRCDAHRVGKCADEVTERQPTLARNIENRNTSAEIALHHLGCEPDLPGRKCRSTLGSCMCSLPTLSHPIWWRGRWPGLRLSSVQRNVYGHTFKAAMATPQAYRSSFFALGTSTHCFLDHHPKLGTVHPQPLVEAIRLFPPLDT